MYIGLHIKCPLQLSHLMKFEFFRQIFEKIFECQIPEKSVQWEPSCSMRRHGRTNERTNERTTRTTLTATFATLRTRLKTHKFLCEHTFVYFFFSPRPLCVLFLSRLETIAINLLLCFKLFFVLGKFSCKFTILFAAPVQQHVMWNMELKTDFPITCVTISVAEGVWASRWVS